MRNQCLVLLCMLAAVPGAMAFEDTWDFSRGMGEWCIQEGEWTVEEGALVRYDPHFKGGLAGLPGVALSDFTIEADVQLRELFWDKLTVWAGFLVRSANPVATGGWRDGFKLILRANGEAVLAEAAGEGKVLGQAETDLRPAEKPVRLRLTAKNDHFSVWADDKLLIEGVSASFPVGEVALTNFGNVATFDNVRLTGTAVERPAPARLKPIQPSPVKGAPIMPRPRIVARKNPGEPGGFFEKASGKPFFPRGFNHTVLEHYDAGWHATFNTGVYDAEAMDATLAAMAKAGANTIRVWIWGTQKATGFTGDKDAKGLNGAYMENVVDFLRKCTEHGLYVVPILDEVPHNAYYNSISDEADHGKADRRIAGYNRQILSPGPIAAKAQAAKDFVSYIKAADPALLNTVLGWSFFNEACVNHTEGPFMYDAGTVTCANGKTYDMADKDQRQACYDDSVVHWANSLAAAVKSVDPEALCTVGMWTSDAHGRPPYNGLLPDDTDPRRPPRPSVLAGPDSKLDFIDVHIYPWDKTSKVRQEAHETALVQQGTIPAIVGEYGTFKHISTIGETRVMLPEMLKQAYEMGYVGQLFWVWDLSMVAQQTWSAVEEDLAAFVMQLTPDRLLENE